MKVVIIGGVAGGMSAAARLRRLDEHAEITVYEMSEHVSYANCGLPYFVSDVISRRDNLLLQTPTARMNTAGDIAFTASHNSPYSRYNVTLQPFSWLEGTFRYINVSNIRYCCTWC